MTEGSRCLVALAEHAEAIRREEVRRCRRLRRDENALAVAEQVSASLIAGLLRPISLHVATCHNRDEVERYIRQLFDLPEELGPEADEITPGAAA
jgi:glutamyl-tRNAGlu reductase-like protein